MSSDAALPQLPPRAPDSHKGHFGRVLVVAGSRGMSGAAALCARAALRSGAGLVRVAVPVGIQAVVASLDPCYTTHGLAEDEAGRIGDAGIAPVLDLLADNDVVAAGPGLGQSRALRELLRALLTQATVPLVIDADGLNNLARLRTWPEQQPAPRVLTPHPGEMRRLWIGLQRQPAPVARADWAEALARAVGAVVVLKGAATVVTDGDRTHVNTTGNAGMATGGAGDVLTGVIAALIGQGLPPREAAVLGAHVHGLAGDLAAAELGPIGLTAGDIAASLPAAFQRVTSA